MNDDDLPQMLRDAYRQLPPTAEPSPLLWRRTRATLNTTGMLRRPRHARVWTPASLIAAILVGIVIGWGAGRQSTPAQHLRRPDAASATPLQAAQQVQQTGTAHALALEALVRSLEHARVEELMVGQQVTMAALRAQSRALVRLVQTDAAIMPDTRATTVKPVIWF